MNHRATKELENLGFKNAIMAKRSLKRRVEEVRLRSDTTTTPGTRNHQELLARDLHTAEKFLGQQMGEICTIQMMSCSV